MVKRGGGSGPPGPPPPPSAPVNSEPSYNWPVSISWPACMHEISSASLMYNYYVHTCMYAAKFRVKLAGASKVPSNFYTWWSRNRGPTPLPLPCPLSPAPFL